MKQVFIFLFLSFGMYACAQKSQQKESIKLLSDLSVSEMEVVFDDANADFKTQEMNRFLNTVCQELNGTVLVAKGDSVIFRKTTGYVRLYENKKGYENWTNAEMRTARNKNSNLLKNNTYYELASVSKQFTAAAILKLVNEGKLKLTDSLYQFYPELPYGNVTIHQLLSHTSGLPEYIDFPVHDFDTSHFLTNQEMIAVLAEKKLPPQFNPGYAFKYTNTNYALLAAIIEKVADIWFEEYIYQNVFVPAGMINTFFVSQLDAKKNEKSIAKGHLRNKEEVPYYYLDGTMGDKGIYSTPEDLLKWKITFFDKKKIIPEALVKKATTKQNYIKGKGTASEIYGYGFRIEDNPYLGKLVYHGGLWRGNQHVMVYYPKDDLFIVFLSNYRNRAHIGKSNEILHILEGA